MSAWISRRRLVAFFVLAYAIAWVGWPIWAVGLLPEPLFLPCGPLVAALVVIAVTEGKPGFRALLDRMTRWRVGAVWWAAALAIPVAIVLVTVVLNTAAGAPVPALARVAWGDLALLLGLYLINPLGGAFGEEPGWRGYALPHLQADQPPWRAALVLGARVAGWHVPLVAFGWLAAIGLVTTFFITIIYAWLFNRSGGSALITLVAHAVQDAFTVGSLGYVAADVARAQYLYCLVVVVVAAGLVVVDHRAWRRSEPAPQTSGPGGAG